MDLPRSGQPSVSKETVDNVQVASQRSPQKSISRASRELQVPKEPFLRSYINGYAFILENCKLFKLCSQTIIFDALDLLLSCCRKSKKTISTYKDNEYQSHVPSLTWFFPVGFFSLGGTSRILSSRIIFMISAHFVRSLLKAFKQLTLMCFRAYGR